VTRLQVAAPSRVAVLVTMRGAVWLAAPTDEHAWGVFAPGGGVLRGLDAVDAIDGWDASVRAVVADYDDCAIRYGRRRTVAGWELVEVLP